MTTHHYELPKPKHSSWGGLSDEAMHALTHVAMGPSTAGELLDASAPDTQAQNGEKLSPEALLWAITELDADLANGALGSWQRYETILGSTVPCNVNELLQTNPNFVSTLNRLYTAKQELTASGATTPEGLNVGDTMQLVAVPWQALSDNRPLLLEWFDSMQKLKGYSGEFMHRRILDAITEDQPLYRDTNNPRRHLTSTEYLAQKIEQDGPWGVILTQRGGRPGLAYSATRTFGSHSPNALTNSGVDHFKVAGHVVDNMGIYEWLGLALQERPGMVGTEETFFSWMLANRIDSPAGPLVPQGVWSTSQFILDLTRPDIDYADSRPHLTVM